MSDKIEDYVNGNEEVSSEKVIENSKDADDGADRTQKAVDTDYYTENYENHGKSRRDPKKRVKKNRTFAVVLSTALITAIIIASAFMAAAPFITPYINDFWGIEDEPQIVYRETGEDKTIEFDESKETATPVKETEENENEATRVYIDVRQDDQTITKIAKVASPSVVGIKVSYDIFSYFYGEQSTNSQGSGIILTSDGYIITNYHVIQDVFAQSSRNPRVEVFLTGENEEPYPAKVIGYEASKDLAVIKIEATGLIPAQIGDSDKIQVGELAVAIGNPGGIGLMGSVTSGIISGLNRQLPLTGVENMNLIQTDAAINPGNSGGALLNSKGQVIGINEAKIAAQGYEGLGFAIPINEAMESYERILENKTTEKNLTVGIYIDERYTKEFADSRELPYGLLVRDVIPTSGAFKAGIKINDIITKINDVPVTTIEEFNEEKNKYEAGDIVKMEIYRLDKEGEGEYITVDVEIMSAFDFE